MSDPTAQITASASPTFNDTVPALTVNSVAHPDTWNPIHQKLLDNTVVLKDTLAAVNLTIGQLDTRMDGVEVTSSVALDRAMRLNWLYGTARMSLELFTPAWTLRELNPINVTGAIGGDDSIDLVSTDGIIVGHDYVISSAAGQEMVRVAAVLSVNRVRISAALARTYAAGSKFGSTNWAVGDGLATTNDGSFYLSGVLNLSATLGNHMVVIRRTTSPAQVRLFFTDALNVAYRECALVQQVATGVADAGMADYVYYVPATGDFRLQLTTSGGVINIKHIAAVSGKATTLGGYGIADAYTKPEVDSKVDAVPKTRVISIPTMTGPTSVTPGTAFTLTATSTARLTGATVASFDFTKPDNSKVNVVAASGSASLSMTVLGSLGDTRNVLVEAIDSEGNRSAVKTHTVTITSNNAPSMATFAHTIPVSAIQATITTVKFSGATDADGDAITYTVDPGASGVTFSKLNGIGANEIVTMTVPGSVLPSKTVTLTVYAVDTKGAQTAATCTLTIVGQSLWEFATAGITNWAAPAEGNYEIVVVGGGGGGGKYNGGGGGSGFAGKYIGRLAASASLPVTVGQGGIGSSTDSVLAANGGASSVGSLVTALGGYGGGSGWITAPNGGNGGSGGGCGAAGGSQYTAGFGGSNGSNGITTPAATGAGGVGGGINYYSSIDNGVTHGGGGSGAAGDNSGGGGGGGWGNTPPAEIFVYPSNTDGGSGGGYGAGGGGTFYGGIKGKDGRSGYVRIKYLGA